MRRYISICFLWMFCMTLWGQSNNGYGGKFDPVNPDNPSGGIYIQKYDLKVTANKGGSVDRSPSETSYAAGTSIYLYASPNSGYKFKYWAQGDSILSGSQWFYYTMPAKKSEIKAVFEFNPDVPDNPSPNYTPKTYKVTVSSQNSRGGSVYCSSEKFEEGSYTYVSASPYSGYKFTGWYLDGNLVSNSQDYYFEMEGRDMHFTAHFVFDPDAPDNPNNNPNNNPLYTIEYKIDGKVCHTDRLPAGATITQIALPTKEGYTFSGWSDAPATMPAKNITISGTFSINYYKLQYVIDGTTVATYNIAYGSDITQFAAPAKEGYTFSGWSETPATMPAKDVTITGSYSVNSYKITYLVDGAVYSSATVAYGTKITPIAAPIKEGYTFSGWSETPATMPAEDITISGTYSVNSYKITYLVDGVVYSSATVAYGTKITPIAAPAKEGYTFSGWSETPATMPAKDVTITGSYSVNSYKITYLVDGAVYSSATVAYGTKITPIAAPAKEGYTFSGWSETPATMPAEDITISGTFSKIYLVNWAFDETTGTLVISGSGEMEDYLDPDSTPWSDIRDDIKKIVVEEGVTSIGNNAFNGCPGLTNLVISNTITSIGNLAFYNCENLVSIITNILAENLFAISDGTFAGVDKNSCTLYVPYGSKATYATTSGWKEFANIVETNPEISISVDNLSTPPGRSITLPFGMTNKGGITAFQIDVEVPEGIEFVSATLSDERKTTTHYLNTSVLATGKRRIIAYSNENKAFKLSEGTLLNINLDVAKEIENGDYKVNISNIRMVMPNSNEILLDPISANINVKLLMGDANDDNDVTMGDVVSVANYILELLFGAFNFDAADINGDGQITMGDLVAIINIILYPEDYDYGRNAKRGVMAASGTEISLPDTRSTDEAVSVPVSLSSTMAYTAFQMDIELPEGAKLTSAALTERAAAHSVAWSCLPDGKMRVVAYSLDNEAFSGNAGELVALNIEAEGAVSGAISVENVRMVTPSGDEYAIGNCGSLLDINGTTGINGTEAGSLKVYTADGALIVESGKAMKAAVYSVSGKLVKMLDVEEGKNVYEGIPAGTYVVAGVKVAIK